MKKDLFGRAIMLVIPPVFANETFRAGIIGNVFSRNILECNINIEDQNLGVLHTL